MQMAEYSVWFVTGSQGLYGEETLEQVADDARKIAEGLNESPQLPVHVVYKPILTSSEAILSICRDANGDDGCIGIIAWMHTFSPAKMWIAGLKSLDKPLVHLHTQYNKEIPWSKINMDFMNLNQSAHGGREFGFIVSRLRMQRKVIAGYWQDLRVLEQLATWTRAATAVHDSRFSRIARFGDNMRNVAVTEGDKVEAQIRFGYAVDGYGVGDLIGYLEAVSDGEVRNLLDEYEESYVLEDHVQSGGARRSSLEEAAKIECAMRAFLEDGGFTGFTTTFENLHGLSQLPGLAVQRLMADGYGFGAEGDWKTAALVRSMKVMGQDIEGGTSFMEDYTYHLADDRKMVLGAHMLEVCPSIASTNKPSLQVHPLSIGGKADPARLVFDAAPGQALNATIVDMGNRFRMVVNEVEVVEPTEELPQLPVARALWIPKPDLPTSAAAWILAGGAHHSGFTEALTPAHLEDFAEMTGIEYLLIDESTTLAAIKKELRWNEIYYQMRQDV